MAESIGEFDRETRHMLNNHMQITQIKLDTLDKASEARHATLASGVAELKSILKWAGGLIISLMISFMGWAVLQQYNANEAQKTELKSQMNMMQQQERARNESREAILNRLPPSAAQGPVAPSGN